VEIRFGMRTNEINKSTLLGVPYASRRLEITVRLGPLSSSNRSSTGRASII
jgi:hypothetical protein